MAQHNESSVEEILESIKKVMARDIEADPQADPVELHENDILDLAELECIENGESDETPLTTENVREGMRKNFAALAMLAEPGAKPQIVRSGETSLEGMVREMLRPLLADWLDQNLPEIVERMVQAEIARIAGKQS